MKKSIKAAIAVGMIGVLALSAGFLKKSLEVETVTVEPKLVVDTFTEDGVIKAGENMNIVSEVTGKVKEVCVGQNSYVKQGDLIAKIDTTDYEDEKRLRQNNIASYQAKIAEAFNNEKNDKDQITFNIDVLNQELRTFENNKKASQINKVINSTPQDYITILELSLELSQSDYNYSKTSYDHLKALYDAQAISKAQLDEAENAYIKAQTALAKAQTQLSSSKTQLEKLKLDSVDESTLNTYFYKYQDEDLEASIQSANIKIAALKQKLSADYSKHTVEQLNAFIENENVALKQLDDNIADCNIVAKTSGYIIELPIKNQSVVNPADAIATIKAEKLYTVEAEVLTSAAPYLKSGDAVIITQKLRGKDVLINGRIKDIYNFATKGVSALGLEEYRIKVVLEIEDRNIELKDGYQVDVTFTTYKADNQIALPNSAVFKVEDKDYVFKLEGKKAVLTNIKTSYKTNTQTIVESGISQGDSFVYNANTEGLYDGVVVAVKQKK